MSTCRYEECDGDFHHCPDCEGGYILDECFEDTCCCADPDNDHELVTCETCGGRGGLALSGSGGGGVMELTGGITVRKRPIPKHRRRDRPRVSCWMWVTETKPTYYDVCTIDGARGIFLDLAQRVRMRKP